MRGDKTTYALEKRPSRHFFLVCFAAIFIASSVWSFAMPIFSGADENVHAITDYSFFHGNLLPKLTSNPGPGYPNQFDPALITVKGLNGANWPAGGFGCFLGEFRQPANCDRLSMVGRVNSSNKYYDYVSHEPPIPTLLTGFPVAISPGKIGFFLSRLLTAFFFSFLLSLALSIAVFYKKRFLTAAIALGVTPAAFALSGVLGTAWLEIGLTALSCTALVCLFDNLNHSQEWLLNVFCISVSFLFFSQATSMPVALLIIAFAIFGRPSSNFLKNLMKSRRAILLSVAFITSLFWLKYCEAPVNSRAIKILINNYGESISLGAQKIVELNFKNFPVLWSTVIQGQSWTPGEYNGSAFITVIWLAIAITFLVFSLYRANARLRILIGAATAIVVLLPIAFALYFWGRTTSNSFWLGRYEIPFFLMLLIFSSISLERSESSILEKFLRYLHPAVCLMQFIFLLLVLHRYAVGVNGTWNIFNWGSGWHPVIPAEILIILSLSSLCVLYSVLDYQSLDFNLSVRLNFKRKLINARSSFIKTFLEGKITPLTITFLVGLLIVIAFAIQSATATRSIPSQDAYPTITSVSCVSASQCVAVDNFGRIAQITINKRSYFKQSASESNPINTASCYTKQLCVLGNDLGQVLQLKLHKPKIWKTINKNSYLIGSSFTGVTSVSCVTVVYCLAVDAEGKSEVFNGRHWSSPTLIGPQFAPASSLASGASFVSCFVSTFCLAGSGSGYVSSWNGRSWSNSVQVFPTENSSQYTGGFPGITSISCFAMNKCFISTVVGFIYKYLNGVISQETFERSVPSLMTNDAFVTSLSCNLSEVCIAGTSNGYLLTGDNGTWKLIKADSSMMPIVGVSTAGVNKFIYWNYRNSVFTLNARTKKFSEIFKYDYLQNWLMPVK